MNLELVKAMVTKFECKMKDGNNVKYPYDAKDVFYPLCIYDAEHKIAFNIENSEQYYVLDRDPYYRLAAHEEKNIEIGKNYVLEIEKVNWLEYNVLQRNLIKLKYTRMLHRIKHIVYADKINKFNDRENWRSNYNNSSNNNQKVKK